MAEGHTWGKSEPTYHDVVNQAIKELRNPLIWHRSIRHLSVRGEITNTPKDISNLIAEVQRDVLSGYEEYIKGELWNLAQKAIKRACAKSLPEWYKEELASKS